MEFRSSRCSDGKLKPGIQITTKKSGFQSREVQYVQVIKSLHEENQELKKILQQNPKHHHKKPEINDNVVCGKVYEVIPASQNHPHQIRRLVNYSPPSSKVGSSSYFSPSKDNKLNQSVIPQVSFSVLDSCIEEESEQNPFSIIDNLKTMKSQIHEKYPHPNNQNKEVSLSSFHPRQMINNIMSKTHCNHETLIKNQKIERKKLKEDDQKGFSDGYSDGCSRIDDKIVAVDFKKKENTSSFVNNSMVSNQMSNNCCLKSENLKNSQCSKKQKQTELNCSKISQNKNIKEDSLCRVSAREEEESYYVDEEKQNRIENLISRQNHQGSIDHNHNQLKIESKDTFFQNQHSNSEQNKCKSHFYQIQDRCLTTRKQPLLKQCSNQLYYGYSQKHQKLTETLIYKHLYSINSQVKRNKQWEINEDNAKRKQFEHRSHRRSITNRKYL